MSRKKDNRRSHKDDDLELLPGESVLFRVHPWRGATWPKYVYTVGLYGIWRKRHSIVLTDHRVLLGKGIFTRTERSLPLSRVEAAIYARVGAYGYCDVHYTARGTRQTERLGPLSPKTARRFANAITAHL
jgi:hypothetical protein